VIATTIKQKPAANRAAGPVFSQRSARDDGSLFLPRALLVAVRLQALAALVLVHLQTAFLFQVTHWRSKVLRETAPCGAFSAL
jgi:hypothetical protein